VILHDSLPRRNFLTTCQLEREVSELESLIESKIYQQDDLEQRIAELEREIDRLRADRSSSHAAPDHRAASIGDRSRASSTTGSLHTAEDDTRCEPCEGPHDLDACPVFAGNLDAMKVSPLASKGGKFCADCEVSDGDQVDLQE
jgi:CAP-Gly domain-containing linker protein 1